MSRVPVTEERCFVLYNADKQEKIGVFLLNQLSKFVYGHTPTYFQKNGLFSYAHQKSTLKTKSSRLPFNAAIRFGTESDMNGIGKDGFYLINQEYSKFTITNMKSADISSYTKARQKK